VESYNITMDRASPLIEHNAVWPCRGMSMEYMTGWVQAHNLRTLKFPGVPEDVERSYRELLPPLLASCSNSLTGLSRSYAETNVRFHPLKSMSKSYELTRLRSARSSLYDHQICSNTIHFPVLGIMDLETTIPLLGVGLLFLHSSASPMAPIRPAQRFTLSVYIGSTREPRRGVNGNGPKRA
jgi:hypothetical protein